MNKNSLLIVFCWLLMLAGCKKDKTEDDILPEPDPVAPVIPANYTITEAFPNIQVTKPIELTSPADGTDRIFVAAQEGKIYVFPNNSAAQAPTLFLDITGKVTGGGEKGLLGLAFHPDYKSNGYFYVNYTRGNLETAISRFKVSTTNPNSADPASETVLLTFNQPYDNHNGGKVAFGNDGYLYIASGDGGNGGDPQNYAQNRQQLLGKILRIDVNNTSGSLKYAIPADNPYINNQQGYREEIYAYGLRNPWRFSIDKTTGMLWAGDVGQNKTEEISIIEKGGNYGWKIMEGDGCYNTATCDQSNLKKPILSYEINSQNGRSVTGGYVCRDKNLTGLEGKYIYGDYVSGNIWVLTFSGNQLVENKLITKLGDNLSSFGEDSKQSLYILGYGKGKIYKFIPGP